MSDLPDEVPQIEEQVLELNLNETDEGAIDLMDGAGLKKPQPIEVDEVFKSNIKKIQKDLDKMPDNLAVMPEEVQDKINKQRLNKNGKPRKPMTQDRLEKLAEARKKALEKRQQNKKLKEEKLQTLKIQKIVDDDKEVIIKPKVIYDKPKVIHEDIEAPTPRVKKLSREEKDKKIQDAVAFGVKQALELERKERKQRKEIKIKKHEEEKKQREQEEKDKQLSETLRKLNDVDNIYDKCFNFI